VPSVSPEPELRLERLRWAGPLVVLLALVAVMVIRVAGIAIVRPDPRFFPLTPAMPAFDTIVLASAAVLVFARFCRDNAHPIADYRRLARWILVVSFIPDVLLALTHGFGGGWPEAFVLMSMHVAVWAVCVTLLPAAVAVKTRDIHLHETESS
jgi:hypothetical protein